ncbi:hypothetical protein BHE74_00008259 [Ensete ventricosum]|nr:hypothetical protein BHE74_00008259 [Ensete ventricosum]
MVITSLHDLPVSLDYIVSNAALFSPSGIATCRATSGWTPVREDGSDRIATKLVTQAVTESRRIPRQVRFGMAYARHVSTGLRELVPGPWPRPFNSPLRLLIGSTTAADRREPEMKGGDLQLPPGFRFHPTDEELVMHYLCRMCAGLPVAVPIVAELDLYKYDPWQLPGRTS